MRVTAARMAYRGRYTHRKKMSTYWSLIHMEPSSRIASRSSLATEPRTFHNDDDDDDDDDNDNVLPADAYVRTFKKVSSEYRVSSER